MLWEGPVAPSDATRAFLHGVLAARQGWGHARGGGGLQERGRRRYQSLKRLWMFPSQSSLSRVSVAGEVEASAA